jgi:DNA invertase Pin-like site-specific DNA recombinase
MQRRRAVPKPATPKSIHAVAYYRMSTDRQDTSIRDQRTHVEQFAAANGYELIGEYADEAISGDATDDRVQFRKMIADAASGRFQAIVVWDLSRLGRYDIVEGGYWMKPLRDANVKVVTLDHGVIDWNDFAARILWTVQQEGKHAYLRDFSRCVARGWLEQIKRGEHLTPAPFGYRKRRQRLVLGSAESVRTVRRIFWEYRRGMRFTPIARMLNEEGIRTARGGVFRSAAIQFILSNRAYLGDLVWGKLQSGKYHRVVGGVVTEVKTRNARTKRSPDGELIVRKGTHEPLIDQKLFDDVQKRLALPRSRPRRPAPELARYPLVGLVRCGECGTKMTGANRASGGKAAYTCETSLNIGTSFCRPNRVKEFEIVNLVMDAVEKHFLSSPTGEKIDIKADNRRQLPKATRDVIQRREELTALEEKVARAEQRLLKVDYDLFDIVQREYRQLRSQRIGARAELRSIEAAAGIAPKKRHPQADRVTLWSSNLYEAIRIANGPVMQKLFREFLDYIEVWTVPYRRYNRTWYRLDRAVIHFGKSLGNLVVRCPEDIPLPPSASAIPHLGNPRQRALRKARRLKIWLETRRRPATGVPRAERRTSSRG